MSGDTTRRAGRAGAGRPLRRWLVVALAGALLLTGCVSMPGSGPVQRVDSSQRADSDSQVRVFGVSPQRGMEPLEIVQGFLEAITSDEVDFRTARRYLTPERRETWDPFHRITVLASGPAPTIRPGYQEAAGIYAVGLRGDHLATVDASHVYAPRQGTYEASFQLARVRGEWRIDALPDGLVMGEADFERNYRSVDTYYYADLGPEAAEADAGDDVLVTDPVYVRRRINPARELVASLLDGPGPWLDPVATTAFPEGVGLARGSAPFVEDTGVLTTRLSGVPADLPRSQCRRMAAQLLHTVQELSSVQATESVIDDRSGGRLCEISLVEAGEYAPGLLDGDIAQAYALTEDRRLASVSSADREPRLVSGALGRHLELGNAAVSRDERWAAGVTADGAALYVAPLSGGEPLPEPAYLGSPGDGDEPGLTAPSWDGLGDLWFADRSRLMRMADGRDEPVEIPVVGLGGDERIEALRVASDGVRVAMLISEDGRTTLRLGRIERTETMAGGTRIEVDGLRALTPRMEHVSAASWGTGGSRLVVVGRPANGVEQLQYVSSDGSPATAPSALPGLNDVSGVAACEDEELPLLAETGDGIARLSDDAQWRLLPGHGSHPVYPG